MAYKRISPVPVIEGGTGLITTTTPYGVVCAGTTATSALQTLSALGASGTILTSNGASALPSFQAGAGVSVAITPDSGGTITSGTFTLSAGPGLTPPNCGSSVSFTGSGTTLLLNVTDSNNNTIIGGSAGGTSISSGAGNAGFGGNTFRYLTTGSYNTACGTAALVNVISGNYNTAVGYNALNGADTYSYSTALGYSAGSASLGADNSNICIGYNVTGVNGRSNSLQIGIDTGTSAGYLNSAFISGITGKTSSSGAAVYVNSNNQLGTSTSSIKYKHSINDMGEDSALIYSLRPVTFGYKPDDTHVSEDESKIKQYGLIAEEVLPIYPDMVLYKRDGEIDTLKYQNLPPMILNELQKLAKRVTDLELRLGAK